MGYTVAAPVMAGPSEEQVVAALTEAGYLGAYLGLPAYAGLRTALGPNATANIGVTVLGTVYVGVFGSYAALIVKLPVQGVSILLVAVVAAALTAGTSAPASNGRLIIAATLRLTRAMTESFRNGDGEWLGD